MDAGREIGVKWDDPTRLFDLAGEANRAQVIPVKGDRCCDDDLPILAADAGHLVGQSSVHPDRVGVA